MAQTSIFQQNYNTFTKGTQYTTGWLDTQGSEFTKIFIDAYLKNGLKLEVAYSNNSDGSDYQDKNVYITERKEFLITLDNVAQYINITVINNQHDDAGKTFINVLINQESGGGGGASTDVTVLGEVEIKNDVGNPIPVSGEVNINDTTPINVQGEVNIDDSTPINIQGEVNIDDTTPINVDLNNNEISINKKQYSSKALSADRDIFGSLKTTNSISDIEIDFSRGILDTVVKTTTTDSGTVTSQDAKVIISGGGNSSALSRVETISRLRYRPAHESNFIFTAIFKNVDPTDGLRIGGFDDNDGYFIGYNGGVFGITIRRGGSDTFISIDNFNTDPLNGSVNSEYTRDDAPEAVDFTQINVFKIRYGWLGASSVLFEILSPDGEWITFHNVKQSNADDKPHSFNPSLPLRAEVVNGTNGNSPELHSASWAAQWNGDNRDNIIDFGNSYSTPLNSNEIFTGSGRELTDTTQLNIWVYADQDSTVNGLKFQFSVDGINWRTFREFTYTSGSIRTFQYGPYARYFRVIFENDSVAQSELEIQTILLPNSSPLTIHRVGDDISDDRAVELVKSVITAKDPNNNYINIPVGGVNRDNTTSTLLLASETFTGDYIDVQGQNNILAACVSSHPLDVIRLDWSDDGTNLRQGIINQTDLKDSEILIQGFYIYVTVVTTIIDDFVRLHVENGVDDLTLFDTNFWVSSSPYSGTFTAPEDIISTLSTTLLTRAITVGKQPDGDYVNLPADGEAFFNTDLLLADEEFVSEWYDTDGYSTLEIFCTSDVPSEIQGIIIEFTNDTQADTPIVRGVRYLELTQQMINNGTFVDENVIP